MKQKRKFFRNFCFRSENSTNFANFLGGQIHQIFNNKKIQPTKKKKKKPPPSPVHNYPIPRDAHGRGQGCEPHWTR